jgi:hypothetical protein
MAQEQTPPKKGRREQHRTLFVQIDDLNLNTPKGQDEMLERMQTLLATHDHNGLDLNAFKILQATVKTKTDLNVLRLFTEMRKEMDEWRARQKDQEHLNTKPQ